MSAACIQEHAGHPQSSWIWPTSPRTSPARLLVPQQGSWCRFHPFRGRCSSGFLNSIASPGGAQSQHALLTRKQWPQTLHTGHSHDATPRVRDATTQGWDATQQGTGHILMATDIMAGLSHGEHGMTVWLECSPTAYPQCGHKGV